MAQQFAAILGVGLAIFGLFFLASGEFDTSQPDDSMVLYENDFGQIGSANEDYRNIDFGEITVGETRGDIPVYNREEVTISDRLFGGQTETIEYNATQPEDGNVSFEVLGVEGDGQLSVSVNDREVFSEYLVGGADETIEIPEGELKNGMNTIKVTANRDGFLTGSVEYVLEDFQATVDDRKYHDYETGFRIYDYELEDFDTGQLQLRLPPGTSTKNSPLEVYVNDNEVFSQRTVRGEQTINVTPSNSDLQPGYNEIRFETESDSSYTLENAILSIRFRGAVQLEEVEESFSLNQSELDYAQRDNTNESLRFDYQTMLNNQPMNITLNGNTYEVGEPENGANTVDIDAEDLEEDNRIEIASRNVYELNNFRITSTRED